MDIDDLLFFHIFQVNFYNEKLFKINSLIDNFQIAQITLTKQPSIDTNIPKVAVVFKIYKGDY